MHRYLLLFTVLLLGSCKFDKNNGQELIEMDLDDTLSLVDEELETTDEVLDTPSEFLGALVQKEGKYAILATHLVKSTFEDDYGDPLVVMDMYPETFQYIAVKTPDAPTNKQDSIISLKYKSTTLEYRKVESENTRLLQGTIQNELFILANGIRTGLDRQETLAKLGIREIIKEDTLDIVGDHFDGKITLYFQNDQLAKIALSR